MEDNAETRIMIHRPRPDLLVEFSSEENERRLRVIEESKAFMMNMQYLASGLTERDARLIDAGKRIERSLRALDELIGMAQTETCKAILARERWRIEKANKNTNNL